MKQNKLIEHILKSDLTAMEKRYLEEIVRKENEIKPKYYSNDKPEKRYKTKCTCCGFTFTDSYDGYVDTRDCLYCMNCGAKMDE